MKHIVFAAALAVGFGGAAQAATVVFNFDDLVVGAQVGAYNGAVFTDFEVLSGFGTSVPNFAFNTAATALVDFAPGFTTLSFTAGVFDPYTVSVYSGLGGTGALLGSLVVTDPPSSPFAFAPNSVAFAGTGRSILVVGADSAQFGWDDVTLTVVPEPATWAMLIAGFGLVGVAARRRRLAQA